MTLPALIASQKLWTARTKYRYAKWQQYKKVNNVELRIKWYRLWDEAVENVKKRNAEIEKARNSAWITSVTSKLVQAVAEFEGGKGSDGRFHPYRDAVGVWTIGYGHTEGVSSNSPSLSDAEALTLLKHDLNVIYAPLVAKAIKSYGYKLTQDEFNALVSFCYNLGSGYFARGHDLGNALYAKSRSMVVSAILLYNKAGEPPKVLPGLDRRRKWESALFSGKGSYTT